MSALSTEAHRLSIRPLLSRLYTACVQQPSTCLCAQANHTGLSAATEDACSQMQKADAALRLRDTDIRDLRSRLAAAEAAAGGAQDRASHLEGRLAAAESEATE